MDEPEVEELRAFRDAARAGDDGRAAELLAGSPALARAALPDDGVPGAGVTALALAVALDRPSLCTLLLDAGAEANDGAALFVAAAKQRWACADLLRARGGDWNATDAGRRAAPLHWMLDVRHVPAAEERLLAEGADPDLPVGERGETALHVAVRRRRLEAIDLLAAAGATLDARTHGGMTPWRHALRRRFDECAARLAELGADTTRSAADDLAWELWQGELDSARERLAAAPELATRAVPEEARLLPDLAGAGCTDAVSLLLDAGMPIGSQGLDGGTALHQAAWFGQPAVARLLLERGASLSDRVNDHLGTPLGWVAHGSRWSDSARTHAEHYAEIAALLLEAGAAFSGPEYPDEVANLDGAGEEVAAVLRAHGWRRGA